MHIVVLPHLISSLNSAHLLRIPSLGPGYNEGWNTQDSRLTLTKEFTVYIVSHRLLLPYSVQRTVFTKRSKVTPGHSTGHDS
jgi:hypothetical protein